MSFEQINRLQINRNPHGLVPERILDRNRPVSDQVTVVLLTFNCGHRLVPILDHLRDLGLPTIAVDNASVDHTADVLRERGDLEVIALPVNIGAAGRNHGVQRAETRYVLFCDDDGWWQPEGLPAAVALLDAHPRLAVVNARILVGEQGRLDAISVEMADSPLPERAGIPGAVLMSFMGGAVLIRRAAYLEVSGYDPVFFMGGEEETLAHKLVRTGWHLRYLPEVVMRHYPSVANAPHLRAHGMRNTLWNAWLHRRAFSAVRWTVFTLVDTPKNGDWLRGVVMAVKGIRWVARQRRPMSRRLDATLTVTGVDSPTAGRCSTASTRCAPAPATGTSKNTTSGPARPGSRQEILELHLQPAPPGHARPEPGRLSHGSLGRVVGRSAGAVGEHSIERSGWHGFGVAVTMLVVMA